MIGLYLLDIPSPHSRSSPHFGERAFSAGVFWPEAVLLLAFQIYCVTDDRDLYGFGRFVLPPLRGAPFSKGARFLPIESLVPITFRHQPHLCELPNPAHVPFSSFPACTCLTPPHRIRGAPPLRHDSHWLLLVPSVLQKPFESSTSRSSFFPIESFDRKLFCCWHFRFTALQMTETCTVSTGSSSHCFAWSPVRGGPPDL